MKKTFAIALFVLLLTGCDNGNNPVDQSTAAGDVEFSEASMYKTAVASEAEYAQMRMDNVAHDTLRHGRMLGTLKWYVGLNDAQFDTVKVFGKTLFETIQGIRVQVHDSVMTRDEAKVLVQAARDQFVASVQSVLTEDQKTLFDEWIVKFWNKTHGGKRGGRGGHHGHGGHRP